MFVRQEEENLVRTLTGEGSTGSATSEASTQPMAPIATSEASTQPTASVAADTDAIVSTSSQGDDDKEE